MPTAALPQSLLGTKSKPDFLRNSLHFICTPALAFLLLPLLHLPILYFLSVFGCFYFCCLYSCNIFWPSTHFPAEFSLATFTHSERARHCSRMCQSVCELCIYPCKDFCNGGKYSSVEGSATPMKAKSFICTVFFFLNFCCERPFTFFFCFIFCFSTTQHKLLACNLLKQV